jgi:hypothetical protein
MINKKIFVILNFVLLLVFTAATTIFCASANITVNTNNQIKSFDRIFAFGNNVACWGGWQKYVNHRQTIEASGSCYFVRYPGGSTSNQYHWNGEGYYDSLGIWHPSSTTFSTGFICWPLNNGTRNDAYGDGEPSKITDGDLNTKWISYPLLEQPQWVYLNLGSQKTVNKIVLHWGENFAKKYKIQYWSAGTWPWPYNAQNDNWVDLVIVENSTGGVQTHTFQSVTRQIFRVLMLESNSDRYEIKEIYLFNNDTQQTVNQNNYRTQTDCIASSMFPSSYKRQNQWVPDFDFERFMQWCNSFEHGKVYPIITINMGTGTPEEAAAWVYYANKVKGYGIKYWEINNEISGYWEIGGPLSAKDYAQRAIEFIEAMKAIDPTIEVIVTGGCPPDEWSHQYDGKKYIESFLEYFNSKGKSGLINAVGMHWYPYWQNTDEATALSNTTLWDTWLPQVKNWIQLYTPQPNKVKISLSEYSSGGATANTCKLMEALFTVDWVLNFIKNGGDMTNKWDVFNGLGVGPDGTYGDHAFMENGQLSGEYAKYAYQPRSSYWALYMLYHLFSSSSTNTLVGTTTNSSLLSAYANKRTDGILSLIVVNKDPSEDYTAEITLTNFVPKSQCKVYTFTANEYVWHINGINSYADPSNPPTESELNNVSNRFSYTFPKYSITLINLVEQNTNVVLPPKISILSPQENSVVYGEMEIRATATSDVGIKKIELYFDNVLISSTTAGNINYNLDTTKYLNGQHYIKIIAYDLENRISIKQIIINIQNQLSTVYYLLIDDCEDGDTENNLGGHWYNFDDSGSGGNSTVSPKPFSMTQNGYNNSNYCAYMSWKLGNAIQYPYVGLGTNFNDNGVYDISKYDGISFKFKGNKAYQVMLRMPTDGTQNGWASYRVQFSSSSEWVEKTFLWKDFSLPNWSPNKPEDYPLDLTQISGLNFQPVEGTTAGTEGEIWVDDIYLIKLSTQSQQQPPSQTTTYFNLNVVIQPQSAGVVIPSSGTFLAGSTITLVAEAFENYKFIKWQGDIDSTENPLSLVMNSNKSIIAVFELISSTETQKSTQIKKKYLLSADKDGTNDVITFEDDVEYIEIYDVKGKLIKKLFSPKTLDGKNLSAGVYYYRIKLKTEKDIKTGTIVVIK